MPVRRRASVGAQEEEDGAPGGTRTRNPWREAAFQAAASTSFATGAHILTQMTRSEVFQHPLRATAIYSSLPDWALSRKVCTGEYTFCSGDSDFRTTPVDDRRSSLNQIVKSGKRASAPIGESVELQS